MGFLYVVVPLDDQVAALLDDLAIVRPAIPPFGSSPTPRQVFKAINGLAGFDSEVQRFPEQQQIDIDIQQRDGSDGAWVHLSGCAGDDVPCRLSFERSSLEVIDLLLRRLGAACGPLVLWPDCADPTIYAKDKNHDI